MRREKDKITLDDNDLKEIFGLYSSVTQYEKTQIYTQDSGHYFLDEDLSEEYPLTGDKREYALDAWRAVMFFLYSKGFALIKDGKELDLSWAEDEFIK